MNVSAQDAFETVKILYSGAYHYSALAKEKATGRVVWIKRASAPHSSSVDANRLKHECEVSARLAEWGFPYFQEVRRDGARLESVAWNVSGKGMTLREWLDAEGGRAPCGEALQIMLGLVKMLEHFHRLRLVHNNLSPETLWLDEAGRILPIDYCFVREAGSDPAAVYASLDEIRHFAYLSPELTGQLAHSVDERSDLYSLGVIMYEMLTGEMPIRAEHTVQWLHAQVAREVVPPHLRDPGIPLPLSKIALKCLSKTPEERYQSLEALGKDLERCVEQLRKNRWETDFEPAAEDIPAAVRITGQFVGREEELDLLAKLMVRLENPGVRMALISGEPGIGKTALARRLQQIWSGRYRLFVYGKFDQLHRDLPFQPWEDALHEWIRHVLMQDPEEIGRWRRQMEEALGSGIALMTQLVPRMEKIVGSKPIAGKLQGHELLVRFETVIIDFLRVLPKMGVSVIVLLDDLQWADPASAKLITTILDQEDLSHLLLIGTYRDGPDEVGATWRQTLERLQIYEEKILRIRLKPLSEDKIAEWLAAAFRCRKREAWNLARRLHEHTGGNPFFVAELFRMLHDSRQIRYDASAGEWVWDAQDTMAAGKAYSNVADLLVARLRNVPPESLRLIQHAACAGDVFALPEVAKVLEDAALDPQEAVQPLVRLGLVVPAGGDAYRFAHDRVRLVAYTMLPAKERAEIHVRLGRLECAYLLGNDAESQQLFQELDQHARTVADRTLSYLTQIRLEVRRDRYETAIRLGLAALRENGIAVPPHPSRWQIAREWLRFGLVSARGKVERLAEMPAAKSRPLEIVVDLIMSLGAATYVRNPELMVYLAIIACRLSFRHGIFHNTGIALVAYALAHLAAAGNIRADGRHQRLNFRPLHDHGRMRQGIESGRVRQARVLLLQRRDGLGRRRALV